MVTKDYNDALNDLPIEAKSIAFAFSVLIPRIMTLPKSDRDDLFELVQELRKDNSREQLAEIVAAMEEIIAQVPVAATKVRDKNGLPSGKLAKWASHVGKKIRELREQGNLTQSVLAARAGIPQSHLSRLELGQHSPTRLTLEKIAHALGVEVGVLDPCTDEE